LNEAEFSETAFERCPGGTSSETKLWRIGASMAFTVPSRRANTHTIQSCATSVSTSRPRARPSSAIVPWVSISMRRRSNRSAMRPVIGTSRIGGANCSAMVMPTAVASWSVRWVSTSQSCAVACIHVPVFETSAPPNQSR
jgi:hypothetical protein